MDYEVQVLDSLSLVVEQLEQLQVICEACLSVYYAVVVIVPLVLIILALNWFFKQFLDRQY